MFAPDYYTALHDSLSERRTIGFRIQIPLVYSSVFLRNKSRRSNIHALFQSCDGYVVGAAAK